MFCFSCSLLNWETRFCVCALLRTDRWRHEGQPAVGVGPHSHALWEETDEEVGEPAPHGPAVSTASSLA